MDITATITTTNTKSPEADTETPSRNQPTKSLSFSNGVLKRHHPHHHHHHHHHHHLAASQLSLPVIYKECLKNHAASLGGHALDGCGEFMPSPNATSTDPTSLKCAACGCHRNFHRRESEEPIPTTTHVIEYQPHHRHHPPPPPLHRSPNSASPPPISSSYYPSAPHMLLALSAGLSAPPESTAAPTNALLSPNPSSRKRFRTKFTQDQKAKMYQFAEGVGWKMQKRDEELVQEFCNEVGVDRGVLKVWMHNNKNSFGKRDTAEGGGGGGLRMLEQDPTNNAHNNEINGGNNNHRSSLENPNHYNPNDNGPNVGTNGSSSSS